MSTAPPAATGLPPGYDYDRPDVSSSTLVPQPGPNDSTNELHKPGSYPPSSPLNASHPSAPLNPPEAGGDARMAAPPAQAHNQEFWQRAAAQERATRRPINWLWRVVIILLIPACAIVALKLSGFF